jgi:hypothetical protein
MLEHSRQGNSQKENERDRDKEKDIYRDRDRERSTDLLLSRSFLQELCSRFSLWVAFPHEVNVRTISSQGNTITLQICPIACKMFTQNRLELNAIVLIETKEVARVIGVGGYRLWCRCMRDGTLIGWTEDTFGSLWEKNQIEVMAVPPSSSLSVTVSSPMSMSWFEEEYDKTLSSTAMTRLNSIYAIDKTFSPSSMSTMIVALKQAAEIEIQAMPLCQSHLPLEDRIAYLREVLSSSLSRSNKKCWREMEDMTLLTWLQVLAKKYHRDVFALSLQTIMINLIQLRQSLSITSNTGKIYFYTSHLICLSVCLSVCLSICLSVCLSVCLSCILDCYANNHFFLSFSF